MLGCRASSACLVCCQTVNNHLLLGNKIVDIFAFIPRSSLQDVSNGIAIIILRMIALTRQGLGNLLVHNHADLHTALGCRLEHIVETVLLIARRRAAQVELGTQPPVEDVDGLASLRQGLGHGPKVRAAIDVPFGAAGSLRRKRLEAVAVVLVGMRLGAVVAMVGMRVVLASGKEVVDATLDLAEDALHDWVLLVSFASFVSFVSVFLVFFLFFEFWCFVLSSVRRKQKLK